MTKYIKHRPFNVVSVALGILGFWFQFLSARRIEGQFFADGMKMEFNPDQLTWLATHYGQIGILLVAFAAISYVWDHHRETRKL